MGLAEGRLERLKKRFDITLAGETNLDLILYGLPEQMPVERELLATDFKVTLGGSSSILAHNLATLGVRTGFVSDVGDDEMGQIALARLRESGADLSQVSRIKGATTGVTVLLPHGSRRHILTHPGVMTELTVERLDLSYLEDSRHFHLSSLFLQTAMHAGLPELFDRLRAAGLTVSLDTNDDPSGQWGGVLHPLLDRIDVLLPNEEEIIKIAKTDSLEAALDVLSKQVPLIVVKCGKRGAVVQAGQHREWVAPTLVEPIDTIGAGDSFNAGFLSSYVKGESPRHAAAIGNITGALSTLRAGGTEAFRDETLRRHFLREHWGDNMSTSQRRADLHVDALPD